MPAVSTCQGCFACAFEAAASAAFAALDLEYSYSYSLAYLSPLMNSTKCFPGVKPI